MAISGSIIPSFSAPKIGGGIGSRASNFVKPKASSLGDIIETISTPIGGGKGANTPKISEGLIGFADTFGSPKTEKRIRTGVTRLKDILIETYDLSKILVATVKKTSDKLKGGLFGGGGGGLGGGLLGGLIGGLVSGVLAVLTKVIVGAALFMAGKWLPEKFPQLVQDEADASVNESVESQGTTSTVDKLKSEQEERSGFNLWRFLGGEGQERKEQIQRVDDGTEKRYGFFGELPRPADAGSEKLQELQDGGIIKGKSHKEGGENINVEDGEAVIPKKTVNMLGVENILRLIQGTNKKNVLSSKTLDSSEDKPEGFMRGLTGITDAMTFGLTDFDKRGSGFLQFNPIGGGEDKKWGTDGIDGSPGSSGVDGIDGSPGVDGIDGSSSIRVIQSKITKIISSESQKKHSKTIVLPIDSAQPPIEPPQPQPRQQIINPNGSAGNAPDIPFPSSTKADSFGSFETRMIYNIVG